LLGDYGEFLKSGAGMNSTFKARYGAPSISRQLAVMESCYSRLKVGLIYAGQYCSIDEARSGIFEDIEVFYNRLRRHSALDYVSPAEFERIGA